MLQRAADASPHNTVRQRLVGDVAARNKDFLVAEKAYGKVMERSRGSTLRTVDDFANLSRVLVERGDVDVITSYSIHYTKLYDARKQQINAAAVSRPTGLFGFMGFSS